MKKILVLVAALIAASTLAAIIRAGKRPDEKFIDIYDGPSSDFLGV